MILYNAAIVSNNFIRSGRVYARLDSTEKRMRDSVEHMLESYHYVHRDSMVAKLRKEGKTFFLDSGAFSAWNMNAVIDIRDYCKYIEKNHDLFHISSVLDAIGDHKGTFWNQRRMEELLPRDMWPLPCYHYGEPLDVLRHYADNYEYITIGGMVPISNKQLIYWLDEIWSKVLVDSKGKPRLKVHGFGLTSLTLMFRYPWHSVDSSSWVQFAGNGMILLPGMGRQINISSKSGQRKTEGQHIDTIPEAQRAAIEAEIIAEGADPQRLRDLYVSRWAFNAWAMPEFVKRRGNGVDTLTQAYEGLF